MSPAFHVLVPAGVVTKMLRAPAAPGGETTVSFVLETTVTVAAATVPNRTVAPVRPVPVTVTVVPPEVGPVFGVTAVTVGTEVAMPVRMAPFTSPATQRFPVGQDTSQITEDPSTSLDVHTGLASPGSVVIRTFPALSVAAQSAALQLRPAIH